MIALEGYDMEKIRAIEKSLIDKYASQDEEDDLEVFLNNKAPKLYLNYLKDFRATKKGLRAKGTRA